MKPPRKFPPFVNQSVTDWLSGQPERIYAVVGNFTFSLSVKNGYVVRITRYSKPDRISDNYFMTGFIACQVKLGEYLKRWSEVWPNDRAITWDDSIVAKTLEPVTQP